MNKTDLIVRQLGLQDYQEIWHNMQEFTDNRNAETTDEIWLVEHHPVFTQGQAGKPEHLLHSSSIPVVQSDRGGQITYHGPGQQIMYVLIDIKRHEHLNVRQLGLQDYQEIWHKMQEFTDNRNPETIDEIWLVEHHPVFTQGQAGKPEHLLQHSNIPVVQSDRGGQITYHAPGQQVMYVLIDIKRHEHLNVRQLVTALEQSVVKTLADYGIEGYPKPDAPGVYIDGKKICSLGLRIRKGCSFHGLAFNINMDLNPFHYINPCGYAGLEMCQLADFIGKEEATLDKVSPKLIKHFAELLGYNVTNL